MSLEVRLQLTGEVDPIGMTWQTAESVLEQVEFDEDPVQTRYNLLLALQEAVTNVYRHGYEQGSTGTCRVEVRLRIEGGELEIQLRDDAPAFDPTQVAEMEDPSAQEEIPEGGYGIHIIRAVVDRMNYSREGSENVLTLCKALAPSTQTLTR